MKSDEQALTEWVSDAITIKSANKHWLFTRAHVVELVTYFLRRQDILIKKLEVDVPSHVYNAPLHVYDFFPVNTLKRFFALLDRGGTITAQEFARCDGIEDIESMLSSTRVSQGVSRGHV